MNAQILGYLRLKNAPQQAKQNIGQPPSKNQKKLCFPNIGICGVYPEAMACNVGGLCSDFNLGERIPWNKSPQQPYFNMHFEIRPLGSLYQDKLTQMKIWAQSANIAGHCLWIDTPHAYVWTTYFF